MNTVTVTTTKGFLNGRQYVGRGQTIQVEEVRMRELEANGLITRTAPEPENKAAPKPKNKVISPPATKVVTKDSTNAADQ